MAKASIYTRGSGGSVNDLPLHIFKVKTQPTSKIISAPVEDGIEVPDMKGNIPAVLNVMKFIYENTMYAELNTKSDYCQECGWDGEIDIVTDKNGKLIWKCPKCGNTNQDTMNIARRSCG